SLAGPGIAALAGLTAFLVPLRGVKLGHLTGLGLISVLPVASLAGLALLVASFVVLLARRKPVPVLFSVILIALIFCLDGVTGLIEPLPRFATAYQVSGYVNYISSHGHVVPALAAYFSWPGFFAMISMITGAAGVHSLLPLMTWWPVVIDLLLLIPFMLFTRTLRLSWRARWFAALLFSLGNWVGQDYFSPQSFNFVLYLAFLAILLTWFSGQRRTGWLKRVAGELPAKQLTTPMRAFCLGLLILIFGVSTLSHQLTPFLVIAACAGLVLVSRCSPRTLPVLLAVIVIGWVSYGAVAYWSGHFHTIFGGIGHLGGAFSSSVSDRVIGTNVHKYVDKSRIGLTAVMILLAAAGLARRWFGGVFDRVLLVLLIAPVTLAGLQNYGGEISLRIYMFALPAISVLAACLFFPGTARSKAPAAVAVPAAGGLIPLRAHGATVEEATGTVDRSGGRRPSMLAIIAAALVAIGLAEVFLLTRYGNEAFEETPAGEYAAMNYVYAHTGKGTAVLWISRPSGVNATPQMPWQYRNIEKVGFVAHDAPRDPADVTALVDRLRRLGRGAFLITTRTESTFIGQTVGFPTSWEQKFRAALSGAPRLRQVYANKDAAVYQARLPASAPKVQPPDLASSPTKETIWSSIGIGLLIAALLLLTAREFIRECVPSRRWMLQPLAIATLPVLVLFIYAIAERFVTLS
ncbi:MAG TPA: hypothetical protein VFI65_23385, partial [Streptosporangiaceae bacterium]|nr:hypothetical protein [Streptosporangiaceae bacterium]